MQAQPIRARPKELPASLANLAPPQDLDAEAVVLSDCCNHPANLDTIGGLLGPEDFYSKPNQRIFEALTELHASGVAIDVATVAGWLRDRQYYPGVVDAPYLGQIIDATPSVANAVPHAVRVRHKSRLRQLIAELKVRAAEAHTDVGDVDEFLRNVEASITELTHEATELSLEPVGHVLRSHVEILRAAQARGGAVAGTPTGLTRLDQKIGGLFDGDLVILAARPGMGKTALAATIAASVARGSSTADPEGVAFFSMEMERRQIALRFACQLHDFSFSNIRRGTLRDEDFTALEKAVTDLSDLPLWVDDRAALSLLELRARARKLQRDIAAGRASPACRRLGLIVVDYLQLMHGTRERGDSRENEIASISRGLKKMAKDLSVPVLALSQLNRAVEKGGRGSKKPGLSDLRESGAIEQDADMVWFVFRPAYYDEEAGPESEIDVAKQRNGPTGSVPVYYHGSRMRFYNLLDEEQWDGVGADGLDEDDEP